MRKISIFILITVLLLTSCACSSSSSAPPPAIYTVEVDGETLTVDTKKHTISDGTDIYDYKIFNNTTDYAVTITYPNGATWRESSTSASGSFGYDEFRYLPGDTLVAALKGSEIQQPPASSKNIFAIILLLALGAFLLIAPYRVWYIGYGWRFKNAEPSDLALGLNRACGVILLIIAVVMIF